jgi:hypothetical protein
VPATVNGVRTVPVGTTARAIASGIVPLSLSLTNSGFAALPAATVSSAIAVKRQVEQDLLKRNPAFFALGVGQSLDNPKEAALVVYVDRKHVPAQLPVTVGGLRTRYVVMDRLHVTRSYALATPSRLHCLPHPTPASMDLRDLFKPHPLPLN